MPYTLHPPPEVIASWPTPNYVDPENRGPALFIICILMSSIATTVVVARIYSRMFITRALGWDDFLVVLALLSAIALSVLVIIGNKSYHSGRHVWDIPPEDFAPHRINTWISSWCFILCAALVKVSVLLFYRRLSVKFSKAFLIATWVGIIYNILYFIAFGVTLLVICRPLNAYWDSFDPVWAATHEYHCGGEGISIPASAGFSVLGDFYAAVLPMFLITGLGLPFRQKVALYSLFALGFLAVIAGIVRTIKTDRLLNRDWDFSWVLWEVWIWSVLELYIAIFAASAPALKPFFRRFFVDSINSLTRGTAARRPYDANPRSNNNQNQWDNSNVNKNSSATGTRRLDIDDKLADVESIGVAYGGSDSDGSAHSRQASFLRDIRNDDLETRYLELRTSRDGKIIPMQVYKRSPNPNGEHMPELSIDSGNFSMTASLPSQTARSSATDNWPIPPFQIAALNGSSKGSVSGKAGPQNQQPSRTGVPGTPLSRSGRSPLYQSQDEYDQFGVQQTTDQRELRTKVSSGSVRAARLRAASSQNYSQEQRGSGFGFGLNPREYQDSHEGLGSGSKLESPSDSEEDGHEDEDEIVDVYSKVDLRSRTAYDKEVPLDADERPPWNTIVSSNSRDRSVGPRRAEVVDVRNTGLSQGRPSERDRSDSDETLHLPRMGSRDFYPERPRERQRQI